ncbi:hypothetical protein INR49_008314 [Caranx melampygus]|nr:hypothetical protein INR49_008314 [Caranx melampygus]
MDLFVLVLCVLLTATSCSANKGVKTGLQMARGSQSVTVQPCWWCLTAVFLSLIVFVILIANRLFGRTGVMRWMGL